MKTLFLIVIALTSSTTYSQNTVLHETFDGNGNGWVINRSGNNQFIIDDGRYIATGKSNDTRFTAIPVNLKDASRYTISASATHLGGTNNYAFGIYFGDKDGWNAYNFVISALGQYKVLGYEKGAYREFIDWAPHTAIKKGNNATNILKVTREGKDLKLYINDQFVTDLPARISTGDLYVGFTRSNNQTVAFDDLLVTE
jgi:hypothetical protein